MSNPYSEYGNPDYAGKTPMASVVSWWRWSRDSKSTYTVTAGDGHFIASWNAVVDDYGNLVKVGDGIAS